MKLRINRFTLMTFLVVLTLLCTIIPAYATVKDDFKAVDSNTIRPATANILWGKGIIATGSEFYKSIEKAQSKKVQFEGVDLSPVVAKAYIANVIWRKDLINNKNPVAAVKDSAKLLNAVYGGGWLKWYWWIIILVAAMTGFSFTPWGRRFKNRFFTHLTSNSTKRLKAATKITEQLQKELAKKGKNSVDKLDQLKAMLKESFEDKHMEIRLDAFEGFIKKIEDAKHEDSKFWIQQWARTNQEHKLVIEIIDSIKRRKQKLSDFAEFNESMRQLADEDKGELHNLVSSRVPLESGVPHNEEKSLRIVEKLFAEWIRIIKNQKNTLKDMEEIFTGKRKIYRFGYRKDGLVDVNQKTKVKTVLKLVAKAAQETEKHREDLKEFRKSELEYYQAIMNIIGPEPHRTVRRGSMSPS